MLLSEKIDDLHLEELHIRDHVQVLSRRLEHGAVSSTGNLEPVFEM